jgi:hypothetical protein
MISSKVKNQHQFTPKVSSSGREERSVYVGNTGEINKRLI